MSTSKTDSTAANTELKAQAAAIQKQQKQQISKLLGSARAAMWAAGICTGISALLLMVPLAAISQITRIFTRGGTLEQAWPVAIIAAVALFFSRVLYLFGLGITHTAEIGLRKKIRMSLVKALGTGPLGRVIDLSPAKIKKSVCDDTDSIHVLVAHLSGDAVHAVTLFVAGSVYLFAVNWLMYFIILLIWLVLSALFLSTGLKDYAAILGQFSKKQTELTGASGEMVEGMQEIKNFQASYFGTGRFFKAKDEFSKLSYQWTSKMGFGWAFVMALLQPAGVLMLVAPLCAWQLSVGGLDVAGCVAFLTVCLGIPAGLLHLFILQDELFLAHQAAAATAKFLAIKPLPSPQETTQEVAAACSPQNPLYGSVQFENVRFSYEDDKEVLHDLSVSFAPGSINALVGGSGSGKSTMASLIARFYDVKEGCVKVNGVDVRHYTQEQLLQQLGIVFQTTDLMYDTVFNNIALGKKDATQTEVVRAAQAAQIHERIMRLPQQYQTVIGTDDGMMSGGEKQRITIARAFLQNAPILILDEATAQTDPHSERLIHEALSKLCAGKTVIVIAHRLSTIQHADQIVVLDKGRLIEAGTHDELLAQHGLYERLVQKQSFTWESAGKITDTTNSGCAAQPVPANHNNNENPQEGVAHV